MEDTEGTGGGGHARNLGDERTPVGSTSEESSTTGVIRITARSQGGGYIRARSASGA